MRRSPLGTHLQPSIGGGRGLVADQPLHGLPLHRTPDTMDSFEQLHMSTMGFDDSAAVLEQLARATRHSQVPPPQPQQLNNAVAYSPEHLLPPGMTFSLTAAGLGPLGTASSGMPSQPMVPSMAPVMLPLQSQTTQGSYEQLLDRVAALALAGQVDPSSAQALANSASAQDITLAAEALQQRLQQHQLTNAYSLQQHQQQWTQQSQPPPQQLVAASPISAQQQLHQAQMSMPQAALQRPPHFVCCPHLLSQQPPFDPQESAPPMAEVPSAFAAAQAQQSKAPKASRKSSEKFCSNGVQPQEEIPRDTLRAYLQDLRHEDPERVFVARKINKLGFQSRTLLHRHYSKYGKVAQVLVAHSKVKPFRDSGMQSRTRPGNLALIVMKSKEAVNKVFADGDEQVVEGVNISVHLFDRLRMDWGSCSIKDEESKDGFAAETKEMMGGDVEAAAGMDNIWTTATGMDVGDWRRSRNQWCAESVDHPKRGATAGGSDGGAGPDFAPASLTSLQEPIGFLREPEPIVFLREPPNIVEHYENSPQHLQPDRDDLAHVVSRTWAAALSATAGICGAGDGTSPSDIVSLIRELDSAAQESEKAVHRRQQSLIREATTLKVWIEQQQQTVRHVPNATAQLLEQQAQQLHTLSQFQAQEHQDLHKQQLQALLQVLQQLQGQLLAQGLDGLGSAAPAQQMPPTQFEAAAPAPMPVAMLNSLPPAPGLEAVVSNPSMLEPETEITAALQQRDQGKSKGDEQLTVEETLRAHLMQVQSEDPECIFIARRINKLGFRSKEILRHHYSQYDKVSRVLVAHSKVKPFRDASGHLRTRPGGLGLIVMDSKEAVRRILAPGEEQLIAGHTIRVQAFHRLQDSGGSGSSGSTFSNATTAAGSNCQGSRSSNSSRTNSSESKSSEDGETGSNNGSSGGSEPSP